MASLNVITKRSSAPELKWFLVVLVILLGGVTIGTVAAQEPFLPIVGALGVLLLIVLLKWPDVATLLVIFFIYTNAGPVAIRFHNVPAFVATGFPVILIIPLIWYLLVRREKLVITPVFQLLLMLSVIYTLGAVFSRDINLALPRLEVFYFEGLLLYFLVTNVIRSPLMLKRVVWVLLISGALIGGLSLYQQVTGTFNNNYWGFAQTELEFSFGTGVENLQGEVRQLRLAGSIGEKNRYAQNMLMLVPLGLFQLGIYRSKRLRIFALVCTGLILAGGALAFSRGAAVGFVLMILIMVFLRYIKLFHLILLILGAVLILWIFPQYGLRISSLSAFSELASPQGGSPLAGADGSIRGRATVMISALLMFKDHPVLGVGPGMVQYYMQEYSRQLGIRYLNRDSQAHSLFPGMAAEAGILGLICFALILFIPLRDLARARKQWMESHPDWSYLATGFFQVLISYLVTGLFLHLSYLRFFYLMVALAVVASRLGEMEPASKDEGELPAAQQTGIQNDFLWEQRG
jgi:putative inorganic carbon (hco3(-)) transporter